MPNHAEDDDAFARRMRRKRGEPEPAPRRPPPRPEAVPAPAPAPAALPPRIRSGKTLDGIAEAVSKARSGKHVVYVVHQMSHANYCLNLLRTNGLIAAGKGMKNGKFTFNSRGTLRFAAHTHASRRPEETASTAIVYDHHVLELLAQQGE